MGDEVVVFMSFEDMLYSLKFVDSDEWLAVEVSEQL